MISERFSVRKWLIRYLMTHMKTTKRWWDTSHVKPLKHGKHESITSKCILIKLVKAYRRRVYILYKIKFVELEHGGACL